MIGLPTAYRPSIISDEIILKSIDWLENFPWGKQNTVQNQQLSYKISLNVKDFAPEEIEIKTTGGQLIIEAKHDEKKDDYGIVSRRFVRKYRLPEDCLIAEIQSILSPDGVLNVTVPRKPLPRQNTIIPVSDLNKRSCSKL